MLDDMIICWQNIIENILQTRQYLIQTEYKENVLEIVIIGLLVTTKLIHTTFHDYVYYELKIDAIISRILGS